MYEKLSRDEVIQKCRKDMSVDTSIRDFSVNIVGSEETNFICNQQGLLFRKMKTGFWKEIQNTKNHAKGYNVVIVHKKQYSRAKLILYAFSKISLHEKNRNIYHINMNKLDCNIKNLTLSVPSKT